MEKIDYPTLETSLYVDKLSTGLPVYMWINPNVTNYYATLTVNFGSIDTHFQVGNKEYKLPRGTAHFLEHVKFNEPNGTTAHTFFDETGAYTNAATSYEQTYYEVYASKEMEKNICHLLDFVQTPVFTDELVEKEKGIILEEAKMGQDRPSEHFYYEGIKTLFEHNHKRDYIIGTIQEIKTITKEDLQHAFDAFYTPSNMHLTITGNFNPYEMMAILEENEVKRGVKKKQKVTRIYPKDKEEVVIPYKEIEGKITIPRIEFLYKIPNHHKKENQALLEASLMYLLKNNFGPSSIFRESLLQEDLMTSLSYWTEMDESWIIIGISFETKYPKEIEKRMLNQMKHLVVEEKDVERYKKVSKSAMIYDLDSIEAMNEKIRNYVLIEKKAPSLTDISLESITLDKIKKLQKELENAPFSILVMRPTKKEA